LLVSPDDGAFVEFNDFAHNKLGYTREEFEKLSLSDVEKDGIESEVKIQLSRLLNEGGGEFEAEYCTKSGSIRNVIVTAKVIKLAGKTFLHCVFHDISEIRAVQKSLVESEMQYRQLVELAQEGVWVLNKDFITIFVNPRMTQMLGYSQGEMLGKSLFKFLDPKIVHLAKEFLGKYTQGVDGNFEYEFIRKDGTPIYATIAASQIADDNGEYSGTLALVADITIRKEMENKLEKYSKNLEDIVEEKTKQLKEAQIQLVKSERLAAIGELAGMVGHDLRNPLSGIKNAAYYLQKKDMCQASRSREMLDVIDMCVNHSNKIINDLLEYSRELNLDKENSSLGELIRDAFALVKVPDSIKVRSFYDSEFVLNVDSEKMQRVFVNLIKNSIDAMPEGGEISIRSKVSKDFLELSFVDNGIGISDDVLPKLFMPLFTTKAQGMGFGLAICKRIIDAHGGKIMVETFRGKGTTFKITLPIETSRILEVT
jgi:PAS domain S-box-containing protein